MRKLYWTILALATALVSLMPGISAAGKNLNHNQTRLELSGRSLNHNQTTLRG